MNETKDTTAALAAAREQLRHTIDRLDEIRADLEATAADLRLPEREEDVVASLAGSFELDAVIRCAVHDHLKPLITSLRGLLRRDLYRSSFEASCRDLSGRLPGHDDDKSG